jgi:hypothetical protein
MTAVEFHAARQFVETRFGGCGPLQSLLGQAEEIAREILAHGVYDRMLRGALAARCIRPSGW